MLGHIPIDNFLASEARAYNAFEEYELADDGTIATNFTFREGSFHGPAKEFAPTGFVHDERTNTEWRMQFLWPFKPAYLIIYLDENYEQTIIGVPDRSHVWIMARTPELPDGEYVAAQDLVGRNDLQPPTPADDVERDAGLQFLIEDLIDVLPQLRSR